MVDIGTGISLATVLIGGVVWGIRLEGRVNGQKDLAEQKGTYQEQRFDAIDKRFDKLDDKLDRLLEQRHTR